jgi:hypothetical protein
VVIVEGVVINDEDDEEDELMPIQDDENEENNEYNLFTKLNRTESGGLRDAYKTKSKTSYVNYKIIARYIDFVDDWLTANNINNNINGCSSNSNSNSITNSSDISSSTNSIINVLYPQKI